MGKAFIGNFKGPKGDTGPQGAQGIQGIQGPAGPTGAVDGNTPIGFTEAEALANIESGESISTIFGKTKKILGSLLIGAGSTLLGKNLTANQALVSDASGKVNVSGVTALEMGYLSGATKNIQTQLNEQNEKLGGYLLKNGTTQIFNPVSNLNNFFTGVGLFNEKVSNIPSADWHMIISSGLNGTVVQRAFRLDNGSEMYRYCSSGNWSSWKSTNKIITGSKVINVTADTDWAILFYDFQSQYGYAAVVATNGDYNAKPNRIISTSVQHGNLLLGFQNIIEETGVMRVNYAIFKAV